MPNPVAENPRTESGSPTPDVDVWGSSSDPEIRLDALCEIKHAVLVHRGLRAELERRLDEISGDSGKEREEGLARWMLARYRQAYPLLDQVSKPGPAVLFAMAECCQKGEVQIERPMRRPDLAAKILLAHPDLKKDPRVYRLLVEAQLFDYDMDAVRKSLQGAPAAYKESADYLYAQGRLAEDEGDYEQAENGYLKAIEAEPTHRGALLRLAYQYDLGGDDEQAMQYYERLMDLKPRDLHATLNYGVLLEDHSRYEEAVRLYRTVLAADPTHRRAVAYYRDARGSLNMVFDEDIERRHDKRNRLLRIPISDFELSVRARNCLSKMSIETLSDLVTKTEAELLAYKNFGETSLNEIKVLLESKGLRLGMNLNEDPIPEMPEPVEEPPVRPTPQVALPPGVDPAVLSVVLADLELSVRCRKALAQVKAVTVGDLLAHSEQELLSIKNFGQTSLNELRTKLSEYGVNF